MATLVAVLFDEQASAFEARAALTRMQQEYLIEMEDIVIVTKNDKGKAKLHQAVNLTAFGAAGGSFWGLLIGAIFLNPLLGVAVGAGSGALSGALADIGIDDTMMKDMASSFSPGKAALFILIRKATSDKVLDEIKEFSGKGKLLQSSMTKTDEDALRAVLEADLSS